MKISSLLTHRFSTSLVAGAFLLVAITISGCGGGGSGGTPVDVPPTGGPTPNSVAITGQALKGPMHDSMLEIVDPDGTVLATGQTQNGNFGLTVDIADFPYVEIRTRGGYFMDEATGSRVDVDPGQGLCAIVSASDVQARAHEIVLTPETTIIAHTMRHSMAAGRNLQQAMTHAVDTYHNQFVGDSRPPGMGADTDRPMHFGAPLDPVNAEDSLAWHRARAFSRYAHETGLAPQSMFELMEALGFDMQDGVLDGHAGSDPISFMHASGGPFNMAQHDHALRYAQARAGMLHDDLFTVFNGDGSTEFRHHLELMSLDLMPFDTMHAQHRDGIATTAENLAADNLPAFQHLPVLIDEDGDSQNAAGSYTLRAVPDVDVTIQAPGTSWTTPMLRYNGMQLPPVIRARRGDEMFLTLVNELANMSTIHWHGFKVPGPEDGGPTEPVAPNSTRVYNFTLDQPAASLWFHPHPHGQTAEQVYRGLAGVFLLTDDIDDQLRSGNQVPAIEHDIPVVVQDRLFEAEVSGERLLTYSDDHMSGFGMMGGTTLVNGAELPRLSVETRQYTLRLYNASNSRTYDFALHDGRTFTIVGSDGGWLPEPVQADQIVLSPGERAAIVIDFAADQVGDRLMLVSQPFMGGPAMGMSQFDSSPNHGGMGGMGGGHNGGMHGSGEPRLPGEGIDIMRFDVDTTVADDVLLYDQLPPGAEIWSRLTTEDATNERSFVMSWSHAPGVFLINGKQYSEDRVDETVEKGATEIWEITNTSPVPHPFHAHAIQWQVLDRNGAEPTGVERGWKDTVLVNPGENVRIIGRFEPVNFGKYVYHCHILEHEDAGMMGLFEVLP
jgi:FtsP/CotA-like multicopper oxidase with cupredoxin domain